MSQRASALSAASPVHTQTRARGGLLQRKCACGTHTVAGGECAGCREKKAGTLRRSSLNPQPAARVPELVGEVLSGAGRPLEQGTRSFMETRFGHDFSRVRVHTGGRAEESARSVGARAYTVGQSMVFGVGQYAPETVAGRMLLAHELTHVVQQQSAGSTVQTQLEIGAAGDPAEAEADRVAQQIMNSASELDSTPGVSGGALSPRIMRTPAVLRRQPTASPTTSPTTAPSAAQSGGGNAGPQRVGDTRVVHLPTRHEGEASIIPYVMRELVACPCRRVPQTREGVYWNPNPGNFAIAFRYCRGGVGIDTYGQLKSNLPSVVTSGASPQGTARVGVDVNVRGTVVNGRVQIEVLGTNEPAGTPGRPGAVPAGTPGIGGHARVVVQGQDWLLFFEGEYIRAVGDLAPGVDPNRGRVIFGGERRGTGGQLECHGGAGDYGCIASVRIPFGDAPRPRTEDCSTCFCPPAQPKYTCLDFEEDRQVPTQVETRPLGEYRYYFQYDRTADTTNRAARADSDRQMSDMAREVGSSGGTIESITGYASPEGDEGTHNQELSTNRGLRLAEIVRQRVGSDVQVPPSTGGGELYGRRFTDPTPRAQQAATGSDFRSAEELSHFLIGGDEIPNRELSDRFVHIFNALPEPADRLSLFGMSPGDPLAAETLAAINDFMRHPRRGARPWERIFQYLRVGVVRVRRRVMETVMEWRQGATNILTDDQCTPNARRAEAMQPGFGPIDVSARRPLSTTDQARSECREDVSRADTERGCRYDAPSSGGRPTVAPEVAPRPFGQVGP